MGLMAGAVTRLLMNGMIVDDCVGSPVFVVIIGCPFSGPCLCWYASRMVFLSTVDCVILFSKSFASVFDIPYSFVPIPPLDTRAVTILSG